MTKSLPFKLIVFDWDGTLMDSVAHIVASIQAAAKGLDLPIPSDAAAQDIIGLGLQEAIQRLFPTASPEAVHALTGGYQQKFVAIKHQTTFFAGAEAVLQNLAAQGYWLAVATGKSRRGLDAALASSGLADLFITSRCADETFSKPHPQMMHDILDYCGLSPNEAMMIGDTEYDAAMAVAAGSTAVGVACGVHTPERILAAGATVCLPSVAELPEWLTTI